MRLSDHVTEFKFFESFCLFTSLPDFKPTMFLMSVLESSSVKCAL